MQGCPWLRTDDLQQKPAKARESDPIGIESARLGVASGWYSTKVSGTFVTGPHITQEDCLSKILELNPPPVKKKFIPG